MDTDYWMELAGESIAANVRVGQRFETRDLFDGVAWNALNKGDRIRFGKDFANAVSEGRFPNVERIQRADNNHARYIKKREGDGK